MEGAEHGLLVGHVEVLVRGVVEYTVLAVRDGAGQCRVEGAYSVVRGTHLVGEFTAYLDREGADPVADAVGYRQHAVWLSPDERAELIDELREVIVPRLHNEPSPGRVRHLLSPILFPSEPA